MEQITTIGLDLAKNVFQVHGVDVAGKVLVRKQLRRAEALRFFAALPPCLVGMEACGTAHHRARELTKLGHTVRLVPPANTIVNDRLDLASVDHPGPTYSITSFELMI